MSTFLVIDKPAGITSHDVVAAVRAVTGEKKVGHTGTLDPFATGVLALGLGGATRLMQFLDESLKVYDAVVQLGTATDTGDPTGEVVAEADVPKISDAQLKEVLATFLGERLQTPPAYSAVKVKGKPLYAYARKGETVEVKARPITIHGLELTERGDGWFRVQLSCSRGTYARVIASELGEALGTVGHLRELARTRSGPFVLDGALSMPQLASLAAATSGEPWEDVLLPKRRPREERVPWRPRDEVRASLRPFLMRPIDALSHLPMSDVDPRTAQRIRQGAAPRRIPAGVAIGGQFLIVLGDEIIAVAEAGAQGARTVKVLDAASRRS